MKIFDSVGWNFSALILNSFLLLNICFPKIKWEVETKIWAEDEIYYSFQPSFKNIKVVKGEHVYINTFQVSEATLIYWNYETELTNFYPHEISPARGPLNHWLLPTERGEQVLSHTKERSSIEVPVQSRCRTKSTNLIVKCFLQRSHSISFSGIK